MSLVDGLVGCPWLGSVHWLLLCGGMTRLKCPASPRSGHAFLVLSPFGVGLLTFYFNTCTIKWINENYCFNLSCKFKCYTDYWDLVSYGPLYHCGKVSNDTSYK